MQEENLLRILAICTGNSAEARWPKVYLNIIKITVCDNAKESCPTFPGNARYIHWSLKDPASFEGTTEKKLSAFRKTRNEINHRILEFIK
jgi:protein-tyrosine-phosphatase